MFETPLVTGWEIDSCSLRIDGQSGAFGIDVPYWIVTIVVTTSARPPRLRRPALVAS